LPLTHRYVSIHPTYTPYFGVYVLINLKNKNGNTKQKIRF